MEDKNLLLGKRPLEVEKWRNSEYITDGVYELNYESKNYSETGLKDFEPEKPSLTYDLGQVQNISLIGIVFYKDKIKQTNVSNQKRKYSYSLEISINGENWLILKDEKNEDSDSSICHWNEHSVKARYIRFSNFVNNLNHSIHIVEVEVLSGIISNFEYDKQIEFYELPITPSFLGSYLVDSIINIDETVNKLSAKLENKIKDTEDVYNGILNERKNINESINQLKILGSLKDFSDEAKWNNIKSWIWISVFFIFVIFFFIVVYNFVFIDVFLEQLLKIEDDSEKNIRLVSYFIAKGVLISFYIFCINKLYSIYKSEKHNYIINTHKSMSLRVLLELRAKDLDSVAKDQLLLKSMELILSHQDSGFSKGGESHSPIISSIIENIPKGNI